MNVNNISVGSILKIVNILITRKFNLKISNFIRKMRKKSIDYWCIDLRILQF